MLPAYAELHALSHFSFQRGASSPDEMVARALALGYRALAITDECSMAGVVRAHLAAQGTGLQLLIGTELRISAPELACGGFTLVLLARHRQGYGQLCELITAARGREQRGRERYRLHWQQPPLSEAPLGDVLALLLPWREVAGQAHGSSEADIERAAYWLGQRFLHQAWLGVALHRRLDDALWLARLQTVAQASGLPLVAAGGALMHVRTRKPVLDVMTAIRQHRPVADCGDALSANAEAHLRSRVSLAWIYPRELLDETLRVAALCDFDLSELRYEYPHELVPAGQTPASHLRRLTLLGAAERYPQGVPAPVMAQIDKELDLISALRYEPYFLTVYDVVAFAREQKILCQGRGSAANSAVCYCLGITEVNPAQSTLLFERFISKERNEPPDIDVDFEHQRREEVIQYLYTKYGRHRAALAAAVATYHPRSAIRDVGKALGLAPELVDTLAKGQQWWDGTELMHERLIENGLDPHDRRLRQLLDITRTLMGFPRHLSQHSGGFVLTQDRLTSTVPVVPAAMAGRSIIEWDKDDIDALGLMKVDVLALGMLSALRRMLDMVGAWTGRPLRLQDIPQDDKATYDMICRADTVGVFQIESRAQMSMLPRLRPRTFYDLVIEVAIVRPGPIQGGMVHPFLQRRELARSGGRIDYPSDALKPALARTLGVPIFQEQVMQIAVLAAGFTPGEADQLRRAMAAWRRKGGVDKFHHKLVSGMLANGYTVEFAEAIFRQIEGFGEYGFPESHAASFALLVYSSAWLKQHHPAAFLAALLNSQPMGFYSPSQLVQDAQRHGVEVRPVDVLHSGWDSHLEPSMGDSPQPAVRLGLSLVKGLSIEVAGRIADARAQGGCHDVQELARRAGLDASDLKALAAADALAGLAGHRRQQVWAASAQHVAPALLRGAPVHEAALDLPAAGEGEAVVHDYAALGLSLRQHPLALLRPWLAAQRLMTAAALRDVPDGRLVRACGLVTTRQRPGTAKGVVFVTLEDETGTVQVIVWKALRERQRAPLLQARLLAVYGRWQRTGEDDTHVVTHLIAQHLVDLTPHLHGLATHSRDFR
ncbi:error-prone DNA polymerase [Hydrogenophaga sp. OTU3427]|uniref:error-prone DNA polymerase n=1 Tax=Hydrogenophaga sp. OTU3427 TaxID=3043856 RepID=UPI00313C8F0C